MKSDVSAMHLVTQGLVLREVNYKDADKILTVLTAEGGKRTVKAAACRRRGSRLAASAQLLVWSDMTLFSYKDYWSLNEAESREQFWGVKGDVEKLALGSYFAETVELVADEGRSDDALLALILNSLYALDQFPKPQALIKAVFELKLMCLTGYEPMLNACAVCGEAYPAEPRFHLSDGALHCAHCRGGMGPGISMPLTPAALAAMRHVVYGSPKRIFSFPIDGEGLEKLSHLCEAYLLTQLERGFRTLDFYKMLEVGR